MRVGKFGKGDQIQGKSYLRHREVLRLYRGNGKKTTVSWVFIFSLTKTKMRHEIGS